MGNHRKTMVCIFAVVAVIGMFLCGCGIHRRYSAPEIVPDLKEETTTVQGTTEAEIEIPAERETKVTTSRRIELSSDQQYEANIFLSNFAEQYGFTSYVTANHDVEKMVSFAHRYAKINEPGVLSYDSNMYEVFTLDEANRILERFLGDEVTYSELASFPSPTYSFDSNYHGPFFSNGNIYYDAADGATTTEFVIVDDAYEFDDGHLEMNFTKYERLDFEDYIGGLAITQDIYAMTPMQADSASNLQRIGSGTASVYPKTYNGHNTYRLISYQEN